ncbi:MAG: N-6 DNA methylase [Azospirillum sp.]|nr:N-6 DNA methylase [Azospirillum sp.]
MGSLGSEPDLIAAALGLIGPHRSLSAAETRLIETALPAPDAAVLGRLSAAIAGGGDPLGDAFGRLRSPVQRRAAGATYTPAAIVAAMVAWAADQAPPPARIVDPGAGSGRFVIQAARRFPKAALIAVELDPLAALMLRANLAVHGLAEHATVVVADYRGIDLPALTEPTLFLGNPPYLRHHALGDDWKAWFAATAKDLGAPASKLAGLHIHFFVKTLTLARPGDFGAFITAAEWLDVNYGATLRRLLAGALGGVALHVLEPHTLPFADAVTTGAITCFRIGRRPSQLRVHRVASLDQLGALEGGTSVDWTAVVPLPRWSAILTPQAKIPPGQVELGELCRVHRGQVTGANRVWIAGGQAAALPARLLTPAVTKARELIAAGAALREAGRLRRIVELPVELDQLDPAERAAVERFLAWAKAEGADQGYIARHRAAWWSVALRQPAPILCSYMARRPPAFVRNLCAARHINIAHGLYPRDPMPAATLDALATWLAGHVSVAQGRTYAGGLTKFEPKEIERIAVPLPETLPA